MPTSQQKARRLLREKKAKVIKRFPFTIQLLYSTGETKQNISCGIDSGYKSIGFSCRTDKRELISGEVTLENNVTRRLLEKRMYRRGRRNKLWYRKPRFLNRGIPKGWLPPSIERRYQTHLHVISRLKALLPITDIIIEVGNFDIQKIMNPEIQGKEYQQGPMYGYENRIAYLISREQGKCQCCKNKYKKGDGWRLHHIWGKEKDRPEDWALLHESCHEKLHKNHEEEILRKQKSKSYKDSTFMNIIRNKFQEDIDCQITFGYETHIKRNNLCLNKSHVNDAFVISGGENQERVNQYQVTQKHRNNRCLQLNRKGFRPSIKKNRSIIQPKDLFWVNGIKYSCKGMFNRGSYISYGSKKKEYFKFKEVEKIFRVGSLVWN